MNVSKMLIFLPQAIKPKEIKHRVCDASPSWKKSTATAFGQYSFPIQYKLVSICLQYSDTVAKKSIQSVKIE